MAGERELKRTPAKPGGKKKPVVPIVCGAVAGLAAAGYLGLCAWVSASSTVMPNVSIVGIDVSGMTAQQVQQTLEQLPAQDQAVEIKGGSYTGYLSSGCFQVDPEACAQAALAEGRDNWIAAGAQYIGHMMGSVQDLPVSGVSLTQEGQTALEQELKAVETSIGITSSDKVYEADIEAATLTMTKGYTSLSVDRSAAAESVTQAFAQTGGLKPVVVELTVSEQPPQEPDFDAIYEELHTEPVNAQMDPETYEVTDGAVGIDFDVADLKAAYDKAAEGETFSIPLTVTEPSDTRESLEGKLFADLLADNRTPVGGSSNRRHNVKLSAQACNNYILLPGEEFSYNNTTGSRSADKGYLPAPIYSGGKSVDDTGGGICQTSSTLYYAVLHTTLEIVERHDHMYNTGYVTMGMDATVFYGSLDFRFKNNTDYPIKIVTNYYTEGGKDYLNVKIYGTNVDGRYAVPKSDIYNPVYPTTVYQPKESVARGSLVLDREQYAYTGYTAHTYRNIYEADGTLVETQDRGISSYKMRPNLYYYNPADGDPSTWENGKPPAASATEPTPGTTTPDPGTTTPAPGTTTPDPGTTIPDPGTTTPDPGTTIPDPGTTTPDPGTTAPDPGDIIPDPSAA